MKITFSSLALLFVTALSAGINDLDNSKVLRDLESNGLYFEGRGSTEHLSVDSASDETSFAWLVDRNDCRGIIDITSGVILVGNDSSDDFASSDKFEEHFTLSAVGEGKCTFRMAYA